MRKKGNIPWNKDRKDSEEEKKRKSEVMKKWYEDHPEASGNKSEVMKKWFRDHPHARKGHPPLEG